MFCSLIVFFMTFIFGLPIAFCLILSTAVGLILTDMPLIILAQKVVTGMDSFPLLAIFFFVLSGNLMARGDLTKRLLDFSNLLVGRFKGGLIYVNVLASIIFAGLSGSAVADTAALGPIEIAMMTEDGYSKEFSSAVTIASSIIGPIIPPSIMMVILAMINDVSVGALFLAGFFPGVLIGASIALVGYFLAGKRHEISNQIKLFSKGSLIVVRDSLIALVMPVIILGGILGGIFTATEAASVAAVYGLIITMVIMKNKVGLVLFKEILIDSLKTTTNVMIIIGSANIFCYFMIMKNFPRILMNIFFSVSDKPTIILLMMIILLLFMGCFMEAGAVYIIMTPLLKPIALQIGLDPIHFSLIIIVTTCIGLITPPFGLCLFMGASIGNVSIKALSIAILPFILVEIIVLLIICYFPIFSLFLPKVMGFI